MMTFSETVRHLMAERKLSLIDAQIEASAMMDPRKRQPAAAVDGPVDVGFVGGESVTLSDNAAGEEPVWIQLAMSGSFAGHSAGPFELNTKVFSEIVANFKATQNRAIPIDYEHASELDATSGSVPTSGAPAVGWVTDLKIDGDNLWGLVEWLEPAKSQIRAKQYRFISPAIRFESKDRVTGKPVGARLTSAGLTNLPYLDGMQPLAAKDAAAPATLSFTALTRWLMNERKIGLVAAQIEASAMMAPKVQP
jgi:phage I-like protein